MKSEQIYERLSALYDKLNIEHPAGSQENAKLKAFSQGIYILFEQYDECIKQVFLDTSEGLGLALYCELFNIDYSLTDQEKKDQIKTRWSENHRRFTGNLFKDQIEDLDEGLSFRCMDFVITIDGSISGKEYLLKKISKIIKNFAPPCTVVQFAGDGADFDYWDSLDYFFENYDSMELSFDLLDTIKL